MESRKMVFNIHAGHNPDGKIACGAVGLVKESTEARKIADYVIVGLRGMNFTAYDCTVNDGENQNDVLKKIVDKCNSRIADLNVSIHLNSGRNDYSGDGSIGGVESFCYDLDSPSVPYGREIAKSISSLGFRLRSNTSGVKISKSLYVLKNTKAPTVLIECFFVDDKDDVALYEKVGPKGIANAIIFGLTGVDLNKQNAFDMDVNKDGKVTSDDALAVLDQVSGLTPKTGDYTAEDALKILDEVSGKNNNSSTPSAPNPSKKSIDEIAKEVINGKWGNGDERKKRLTEAGYNHDEVQKKVNALLKK